jgi:glyoxylase-like metal-dependent hydrolase (beta-lactamase superfamily II)
LIHAEKHGSSKGWIKTTKGIIALPADTFVPGHGDPRTKAEIQKRLNEAEAKRAKSASLVAQGKSLDEIKTAVGDPPSATRRRARRAAARRLRPIPRLFTENLQKIVT